VQGDPAVTFGELVEGSLTDEFGLGVVGDEDRRVEQHLVRIEHHSGVIKTAAKSFPSLTCCAVTPAIRPLRLINNLKITKAYKELQTIILM